MPLIPLITQPVLLKAIVDSPYVPHASQEQQSISSVRTMAADGAPPLTHHTMSHTVRESMPACMTSARTLALTACGGLLRAVVRASQTDLACARARPLAGHFGAVRSPRIPTRAACRRSGINPSRCARARRWRARPLPRPRARACPLSPHSRTARAFAHRRYEWPCLEGVETGWNACCIAR